MADIDTSQYFASLTPADHLTRGAMRKLADKIFSEGYPYPNHRIFLRREAGQLAATVAPTSPATSSSGPLDFDSGITTEVDDSDYDTATYKAAPCYVLSLCHDKLPSAATGDWWFGRGDPGQEARTAAIDLLLPGSSPGLIYPTQGHLAFDPRLATFWLHARHQGVVVDGYQLKRNAKVLLLRTSRIEIGPYKFIFQFKIDCEPEFQKLKQDFIERCNAARGQILDIAPAWTAAAPGENDVIIGDWLLHDIVATTHRTTINAASNMKSGKVVAVKRLRIDKVRIDKVGNEKAKRELATYQAIKSTICNHRHARFVMQLYDELRPGHAESVAQEVFMLWDPLALCDFTAFGHGGDWHPQTMETKRLLFFQVACGLSALHDHGWIHRDLKPANLGIVSFLPEPRAVILDTEHAIRAREGGHQPRVGHCGTVGFLAPELENPEYASTYDNKVDIFSLGVVAYVLFLDRKVPWSTDFNMFVPARNMMEPSLRTFYAELETLQAARNGSIESLIARMLETRPSRRPSISEVLAHPALANEAVRVAESTGRVGEKRSIPSGPSRSTR